MTNRAYEGDGKRLLFVDDEPAMISAVVRRCQQRGYAVDTAECGEEALRLYLENRYDLIITDRDMPGMTGVELMREIRRKGNGVPVLLSSCRDMEQDEWRREGFVDFIEKTKLGETLFDYLDQYCGTK